MGVSVSAWFMSGTFVLGPRPVVARSGERDLVTAGEIAPDLIREEEIGLVIAHDGSHARGRYGGRVTGRSATVARLGPSPLRVDLALAIALTIAGELEV